MNSLLIASLLTWLDFIAGECQEQLSVTEQAILDYHNQLRRLHLETPSLCYGMSDSTHTFFPQEWSEFLLPRGPKNAGHSDSTKKQIGENIAWNRKVVDPVADSLSGIKKWYDEILEYDFQGGAESDYNKGKAIGHATQMLWKDTKELRCGRAAGEGKDGVFIVCQYWPKGNIGKLLNHEIKPVRDKQNFPDREISGQIEKRILEKASKVSTNDGEQRNSNDNKRPEETEYSDTELSIIILIATLPCIVIFGTVFCFKKIKARKAQYQPLSQDG